MSFIEWLIEKKGFTKRSAHDAQSRLKRVFAITGKQDINPNTLVDLNKNETFLSLSMSVKSQLRRAVKLYSEFSRN